MNAMAETLLDGITIEGQLNTPDQRLLENVRGAIRRGHPQVWPTAPNGYRVALVGGGPSLEATLPELRRLVWEGAKLVTVNGAYAWCIEHGLQPRAQVLIDARGFNARFVDPEVPECRYYLASQCAPETWDAVAGRPHVGIWHDRSTDDVVSELDRYYLGQWHAIAGGTTVGTRAIGLLWTLGFLRFDLFGFDSCWVDGAHHAYSQTENDRDGRFRLRIHPTGRPEAGRVFTVAGWHVKQLDDLLAMIRMNGDKFALRIHGDGLLAYALAASADVEFTKE